MSFDRLSVGADDDDGNNSIVITTTRLPCGHAIVADGRGDTGRYWSGRPDDGNYKHGRVVDTSTHPGNPGANHILPRRRHRRR